MNIAFPLAESFTSQFGEFASFIPISGQLDLGLGQTDAHKGKELSGLENGPDYRSDLGQCCLAAAWLFQNGLEESHTLSQAIHRSEGSYLHGIMHRREGDYSNANYWFRKAGTHEFFAKLENLIQADSSLEPTLKEELRSFDPVRLTDLVAKKSKEIPVELERATFLELLVVFRYCHDRLQK